jgi:glycosyltransferase involved in cell wall biosynthesis
MEGVVPPFHIMPTNHGYYDQGNQRATMADRYGSQSFARALNQVRPDIVWSLADPFMISHLPAFRDSHGVKLAVWCPIDGEPVPPAYSDLFRRSDYCAGITEWGAGQMSHASGRDIPCIYHGVDTKIFYRETKELREQLRKDASQIGDIPTDCLLLGFVGKNQFRKMPWIIYPLLYYMNSGHWLECLDCEHYIPGPYDKTRRIALPLPRFCPHCGSGNMNEGEPIPTRMWLHMYEKDGGIRFALQEAVWGIEGKITYSKGLSPHKGVLPDQMREFYNLIDVYVTLSGGEGFNIPIIEAAACGVPSVYTNYSGQAEIAKLCGGLPVEPAAFLTEHHTKMHIDRAIADVGEAIGRLVQLKDRESREEQGRMAIRAVDQHFDWNLIVAKWHTIMKDLYTRSRGERVIGGAL